MATDFPTGIDALTNPTATDYLNSPSHAGQHANANDAIEALEAKVGINSSAVTTSLDYKVANMMSLLNPIGTIREFNVATNPGTLLGFGTWSAFGTGRVTVAIDAGQTEFDTNGETGGAKTHTLTGAESGTSVHTHPENAEVRANVSATSAKFFVTSGASNWANAEADGRAAINTKNSSAANASSAHNNLQPYIVVYRWVRTA